MFGPSARLVAYLQALLRPATQLRHERAVIQFRAYLALRGIHFEGLDEESQGFVLADYLVEGHDEALFAPQRGLDFAALQNAHAGRRKYKASAMVLHGWQAGSPPAAALLMPVEVATAAAAVLQLAFRYSLPP